MQHKSRVRKAASQSSAIRRRRLRASKPTEFFCEEVFSNIRLLIAYLDPDFNFVRVNRAYAEAHGHTLRFFPGKNHFDLYPNEENEAIFSQVVKTGNPYSAYTKPFEYVGRPERGVTWGDWNLQPVKTAAGKVTGLILTILNVTERRQAEEALKASEQYARSIIDSSLDMIITVDKERRIVEFNRAAQKTFGYTRDEVLGKHIDMLYADISEGRILHQATFENGRVIQQVANRRKNGEVFTSSVSAATIHNEKGELIGVVGVSRDITEQKREEEKLLYLSTHDIVTGIYNRTFFEEEWGRLERGRHFPVSMLMADVDGLKKINDSQGHAAGDELLRQAARIIQSAFRVEDVVARIGGDEFAVLLPDTDTAAVEIALARVQERLAAYNATGKIPLSLSIGVATGAKGSSLAQILKQADDQMYLDKAAKPRHGTARAPD